MQAIDVENLYFSYGPNQIISDANFSINKGDFAALIGANGSGKTTLMKLILGELEADKGRIRIFGKDVKKDMALPCLRYVPQLGLADNSNFPASCYEVVSTGIYKGLARKLKPEDKRQIDQAFDLVGMGAYKKRNIGRLSGGQRQRILLARALVSAPSILMLDEPTAGVDAETSRSFYKLLKTINEEKRVTIVTITHDIEKIYAYTNRVFCLGECHYHELSQEEIAKEIANKHIHP